MESPATLTPTKLSQAVGISVPYASQLLSTDPEQKRTPSLALAVRIAKATGHRFGPVQDLSEREIDVLAKALAA